MIVGFGKLLAVDLLSHLLLIVDRRKNRSKLQCH